MTIRPTEIAPDFVPVLAHDPRYGWCVARRLGHFWLVCTGGGQWPVKDAYKDDIGTFFEITPTWWAPLPEA